ncbi:NAD-dependent epimerase/dehydratase family protein [Actinokineospora soli]|uniref:NAD-dependent epimerase/dehydratase family protein n=1 Tax=Actinokineospora soli TaxID=1048753 RepID=A0ABW2TPF8_9PSEU
MTPILVTGGTGTLGRAVVRDLTAAGHDVRVFSRRTGGDLVTGKGLPEALADVETVVHLATTLRGPRDVRATRTLVDAATDVRHLVFVSIVGIDRIPIGYYRGKLAAERIVAERPHTILRTTQFHDLVKAILAGMAKLPVMPIPKLRAQPIDVRDVAARLTELATGDPGAEPQTWAARRSGPWPNSPTSTWRPPGNAARRSRSPSPARRSAKAPTSSPARPRAPSPSKGT